MPACHGEVRFTWAVDWGGIESRSIKRLNQFETQLDSDSDALLITSGRFGPLSSEDETLSVRVSPVQVASGCSGVSGTPVRSAVPSRAPRGLKRLRLMRMSQAIPVVTPSGETQWARPRQGTWVDTTQVESKDDVGQEGVAVFDPVDSDDEIDSLVAEPSVRVPSPRHSVIDALEFDLTRDDSDPPSDDMKSSPVLVVGSSAAEVKPEPVQPTQLEGIDPLPSSFNHPESGGAHQTHADADVVAMRMED